MKKNLINILMNERMKPFTFGIIFIPKPFNIIKKSGRGVTFKNGEDPPVCL
jgi:hypothetical protein